MPQVDTWDYDSRRFYLSFDTVTNGVDFAAAYLEERAYRAASGEDVRGKRPMLQGQGFVAKGGGRFTERYVLLLEGARPVPYDTSHTLTMLVEPITQETNPNNALSGADVFDRAPLSPGTEVNIDVGYRQVEVITVSSGSGLDSTQSQQLSTINTLVNSIVQTPGILVDTAFDNLSSFQVSDRELLIRLLKIIGMVPGVTVSFRDPHDGISGFVRTSDGIHRTIVDNGDGSFTISSDA